jgi:hypothetical protein
LCAGADPGEGAHPARAPPKIGKNMIFWRKIVIFHTKYPKHFRASLRSAQFFKVRLPKLEILDSPLVCSFHLESPMLLAKQLTSDIDIETSAYNHMHSTMHTSEFRATVKALTDI